MKQIPPRIYKEMYCPLTSILYAEELIKPYIKLYLTRSTLLWGPAEDRKALTSV